jgi:hypothetical protein
MVDKKEQEAIEYSTQQIASYQFKRRHPEFFASEGNVQAVADALKKRNLPWRLENLERVYQSLVNNCALETPVAPAVEETPKEEKPLPPWGRLDAARVKEIPPDEFRKYMRDPKLKEQFKAELDALQLRR